MNTFRSLTLAIVATVAVAACGGSTNTASPAVNTDPATGIEIPSAVPSAPTVVAPLILDATTTSGSVAVGSAIVFNLAEPASWELSADRPELVKLSQGLDDGTMVLNPGATALEKGTVVITATGLNGATLVFTVEIR